jgi:hypothetical protein
MNVFKTNCANYTQSLTSGLSVFEKGVLRKIFGAKRNEVDEERRRQHKEEIHALNSTPNVIREIKSRKKRWGHEAWMRLGEVHTGFWYEILREGDCLQELGVDGRVIFK